MAAFLDQSAAPDWSLNRFQSADLLQEREAVLADGEHPDAAGHRRARLFDQGGRSGGM